jgi:hypothetical protein
MDVSRSARCAAVFAAISLAALAGAMDALAASSSIALKGPHTNVFGTSFHYVASGSARGAANRVYGWEVPSTPACASSYSGERKRASKFLFTNQSVTTGKHFSITINFSARNTESHRFCTYLINSRTGKTYAHAEATWTNIPAGSTPVSGTLRPTPVGEGQCQAKKYPDLAAYAQIAVSGANCQEAESVALGADAVKGAAYSRAGFSCSGTAEGAGSTWESAWSGTYYVYSCTSGGKQVAFNWGAQYAYVPASSLPTINPAA